MGFRAAAACPGVLGHAVSTAEPPAPRFYNCKFRAGVGAVAAASLRGAGGVVWCGGDSAPSGDRDAGRVEELRVSALDRLRTDEPEPGSEADRYVPETTKGAKVWKHFRLRHSEKGQWGHCDLPDCDQQVPKPPKVWDGTTTSGFIAHLMAKSVQGFPAVCIGTSEKWNNEHGK